MRPFEAPDLAPFFELNTHPLVVDSLGSCPTREQSDAMVGRLAEELEREGWGIWALEVRGGAPFIGFCGLHAAPAELPCAPAVEIGWRLHPDHWRHGYVTEAARAALRYGFVEAGLDEIVSFTTTRNHRSQAVMRRLDMSADPADAFDHPRFEEGSPYRRHVLYRMSRRTWLARQGEAP